MKLIEYVNFICNELKGSVNTDYVKKVALALAELVPVLTSDPLEYIKDLKPLITKYEFLDDDLEHISHMIKLKRDGFPKLLKRNGERANRLESLVKDLNEQKRQLIDIQKFIPFTHEIQRDYLLSQSDGY